MRLCIRIRTVLYQRAQSGSKRVSRRRCARNKYRTYPYTAAHHNVQILHKRIDPSLELAPMPLPEGAVLMHMDYHCCLCISMLPKMLVWNARNKKNARQKCGPQIFESDVWRIIGH